MKSIEKTNKFKLGVLGIGNMGGSILNGIINASIYPNNEICIYDIDQDKIKKYQDLGLPTAKCEKRPQNQPL